MTKFASSSDKLSSSKIVSSGPDGLEGDDGADGAEGADGADGAEGADGADGAEGADASDALRTPGIKFEKSPNLMSSMDLINFLLIILTMTI